MNAITITLLVKAFERHTTNISHCANKSSWSDCVSYEPEMHAYYLWYNTPDNSTHVVTVKSN